MERSENRQSAEVGEGSVPCGDSGRGFPHARGSGDQPPGHGGPRWCCMRVMQERLRSSQEWRFLGWEKCVEEWMLPPAAQNQWLLKYRCSPPSTRNSHWLLSVLCALSLIQLCCCHHIQFCSLACRVRTK